MLLREIVTDVQDPELLACVEEAIAELSPRQRQVLLLTVAGFGQQEIADALGIAQQTVGEYLQIARARLREAL